MTSAGSPMPGGAGADPATPAATVPPAAPAPDGGEVAVRCDNLTFAYEHADGDQLHQVTLAVPRGQRLAVMGASGAGKTTLTMALNGLIPHLHAGRLRGRVQVAGLDTATHPTARLVGHIGLVMQDPETQILGRTVLEDTAWGPANLGLPADEVISRARRALAEVGLDALADRDTDQLSGGQKQRLAIAGILAMDPQVLVMDEPTSELDPAATRAVFELVQRLSRQRGRTVVLVEHEPELVAAFAERLVVLAGGAVAYDGPPGVLLRDPAAAGRLGLRIPQVAEVGHHLAAAGLLPREQVPLTLEEAVPRLRALRGVTTAVKPRPERPAARPESGPAAEPPVVETRALRHVYPGGVTALDGVSVQVRRGEFAALVGRNGAGKTTFARHLNGLLRPTGGSVLVGGEPTTGRGIAELARVVGYVFQNPDHQIFAASAGEEVAYGLRNLGWPEERVQARVREVLELVGLADHAGTHPFRLGKGQRQRLAVASVLALEPQVLVIDEPTTGQDHAGAKAMLRLVADLNADGHTVLVITHDMPLVGAYARRVLVFDRARLAADTTPAELFAQPDLLAATELEAPQAAQLAAALGLPGPVTTVADCLRHWSVADVR